MGRFPVQIVAAGRRPVSSAGRIARLADGWMPQFEPDDAGRAMLARMQGYAREYGRDPAAIGLNGRMAANPVADGGERDWTDRVQAWRDIGGTHLSIDTMRLGLPDVESHISLLERFHAATAAIAAIGMSVEHPSGIFVVDDNVHVEVG